MAKNVFSRYQRVDDSTKQRLIWAGFGEAGAGKTTFALGAPPPIVILSFDMGLEGVIETIAAEKEIYVVSYELMNPDGTELDQARGLEVRDKFIEDYEHAIQNARTVIVDRETDMYDIFKYAEQGGLGADGLTSAEWDKLKARIRRLINMSKTLDVNLGLIQGMKNEWASKTNAGTGKKGITQTGARVRKGMDDVESLVHQNFEHVRAGKEGEPSRFIINVGKSRGPGSKDVQDQQFEGLNFVEMAQLIFPDSKASDWE